MFLTHSIYLKARLVEYFIERGEADEWFKRNIEAIDGEKVRSNHAPTNLLVDWLKPFANEILEVDIQSISFNGPEEVLKKTKYTIMMRAKLKIY